MRRWGWRCLKRDCKRLHTGHEQAWRDNWAKQDRKQFLPLEKCWYWSERKEKPTDSRWLKGEVVWHSAGPAGKAASSLSTKLCPLATLRSKRH